MAESQSKVESNVSCSYTKQRIIDWFKRIRHCSVLKWIKDCCMASPWNALGFILFLGLAMNCGIAWITVKQEKDEKEKEDAKTQHIVPFTFFLCVVIMTIQAALHYCYKIWKLKDRGARVALSLLTIETMYLVTVASALESSQTYAKYQQFCLGPLPTMVVGIVAFFPLEGREEREHEYEKHIVLRKIEELQKKLSSPYSIAMSTAEKDRGIQELVDNAEIGVKSIADKDTEIEDLKKQNEHNKKVHADNEAALRKEIQKLMQKMQEKEVQLTTQAAEMEKLKNQKGALEENRKKLVDKEEASWSLVGALEAEIVDLRKMLPSTTLGSSE